MSEQIKKALAILDAKWVMIEALSEEARVITASDEAVYVEVRIPLLEVQRDIMGSWRWPHPPSQQQVRGELPPLIGHYEEKWATAQPLQTEHIMRLMQEGK